MLKNLRLLLNMLKALLYLAQKANQLILGWITKEILLQTFIPLGESNVVAQAIQASSPSVSVSPELKLQVNGITGVQVEGGGGMSSSMLKNETLSRKAFALQDKLWSIYAAGNTVPIPFLRATDISPIALLSDNILGHMRWGNSETVAVEALQELFTGDGQSKKGRRGQNEMPLPPSVYQRLTSSSTLLNLAQALAYHKMCYEEMPLQDKFQYDPWLLVIWYCC